MAATAAHVHTGIGPLTPFEVSFLAENETVVIVPRQRLDGLDLISGHIPSFHPPRRAIVPIWLALVLKKQKRCNILPPPWLTSHNLETILNWEIENPKAFSPNLPWRWLETAEILLDAATDDIPDAGMGGERDLRVLLRGLREVRQTKAREGMKALESTYMQMNGLGLLEITELRGFASAVVDGLRRLEATREENKRGEEEARLANGGGDYDDNDDDIDTQGGLTAGRSTTGRSTIGRSTVVRSSVAVRGSTVGGGSSVGPRHYDDDDDDF